MQEILRFLTFALAAVFVGGLVYSQYALLRVEMDRRKKLGWGWVGFRSPWSKKDLSERGLGYQRQGLRAIGTSVVALLLIVLASAIAQWSAAA